ncbi:MAG: FHA domain-containing protein [Gemmataceae bacterium]|nr:FHA domain-containing protein [Gemmataceae bacterium]MDW8265498.1 FHA domain-containing protein [Gemmataceae bacterium]
MKLSLVVAEGAHQGKVIPVKRSPFVIGRDSEAQLRLSSLAVSKRHCAVGVRNGKVYVKDLGSRNGTFVNDQAVTEEVEVHHGDRLRIGPLVVEVRLEAGERARPVPTARPAKPTTPESLEEEIGNLLLEETEGPAVEDAAEPAAASSDATVEMPAVATGEGAESKPADQKSAPSSAPKKGLVKHDNATSQAARAILELYTRRNR